ncbi:MAG: hypothetical protein RSD62_06660 [Ruthenibacterium sp.]
MTIRVSRRAAALISSWFMLAGLVVSVLFWSRWFVQTLLCVLLWCAVCMLLGTLYVSSYRVFAGRHHLSVRHGLLFSVIHRVPRRFVTGYYILSSPLQRRTGSCVLVLLYSGGLLVIPGASLEDAEALTAQLAENSAG